MDLKNLRLRDLSLPLRIAVTCVILIIVGGYLMGLLHMWFHVGAKDDEDGMSLVDLMGTYHGVDKPAPLLEALKSGSHRDEYLEGVPVEEIRVLEDWLGAQRHAVPGAADPIQTGYDTPPDGAAEETLLPADVLDERCTRCHAARAQDGDEESRAIPLKRWTDVRNYVYSKKLEPLSVEILAATSHTHFLAIPLFGLVAALFLLATAWPRRLRHWLIMVCFTGLAIDFAGMWLARLDPFFVWFVLVGGGLFGLTLCLALLLSFVDVWFLKSSGD